MSSAKPAKSELRRSLQQARLALGPDERQDKSLAISVSLMRSVDWSGVRKLHCYEPIQRLGEVDLSSFITGLKDGAPDIHIYTSRKIDGEWQTVSTETGAPVLPLKFDAVIVPMLGFDTSLHRIGYGGGYYDKFLASQPGAQKIGVCFEQGRLEQIPVEPHDIPLDMVITEAKTYTP